MTRVSSDASTSRFHPPFHEEACRQSLSSSMAAEGGLPAPLLPLHLPCSPCLDMESPLLLTKEVWLPCSFSLELMGLLLPVTRFCLAICLHLLGISSSQTQNSCGLPRPLTQPVPPTDTRRSTQQDPCVPPQATEGIRRPTWGSST